MDRLPGSECESARHYAGSVRAAIALLAAKEGIEAAKKCLESLLISLYFLLQAIQSGTVELDLRFAGFCECVNQAFRRLLPPRQFFHVCFEAGVERGKARLQSGLLLEQKLYRLLNIHSGLPQPGITSRGPYPGTT